MSDAFVHRVKNSLNQQHYTMNSAWLSECVDFYIAGHENYTEDEVISFVINQWILHDLRDINNDNGCLPRNLANQKCTTLPGKYILQVDKMYDISTSKYKQIEKIRNVSSENIEATENENKTQEDKFQTWEPKSKRMLQLFLTDGLQEILGIEYKTIKFLNDIKEPGFKLMIKGPVICRKGVLLLEEKNIEDKGGEVDSLLVTNALENVLARALNLEENPNPDKNRQKQNTESTQKTSQVDDDFEIDSQALDQIDKQIQQQNTTNASKNSASSNLSSKTKNSPISELNYSYQAPSISNLTQKSSVSSVTNSGGTSNNKKNNKTQQKNKTEKMIVDFDDEGDSFLEMVDDSAFKTPSVSKVSTAQSKVVNTKQTLSSTKSKEDEFPDDNEMYDLTDHSPFFSPPKPKSQSTTMKVSSQKKNVSSITTSSFKNNQKHTNVEETSSFKTNLKENSSIASSYKTTSKFISQNKNTFVPTPSVSDIDNLDRDLDLNDVEFDSFDDYYDTKAKDILKQIKSSSSSPRKESYSINSVPSTDETFYDNDFHEGAYKMCKEKLMDGQKSSQETAKTLPKSNNEESVSKAASSQVSEQPLSTKLSDRLKLDSKTKDYYNTIDTVEDKILNQTSTSSLFKSKNTNSTKEHLALQTTKSSSAKTKVESQDSYKNLDADFENEFDIEFEARMEVDHKPVTQQTQKKTLDKDKSTGYSTTKSQELVDNNSDAKSTGSKRPASLMSPSISNKQKLRCLESMPKDKTSSRKITDFFNKPKPNLLNNLPLPLYEAICDVLESSREKDRMRSVVRGKVTNVVKLNLLKNESGSYFHLEGTITDGTASLDIVFSSEVLEEIVGYSVNEFILKRKRAKADPKIKDELRDDLKKAQSILRVMDALMEIEVKKNEKTLIVGIKPLSKENKKLADERLQRYKAEKNSRK